MDAFKFCKNSSIFLTKCLELIVGAVLVALFTQRSQTLGRVEEEFLITAFYGNFIVTCLVILSYFLEEVIEHRMGLVVSLLGVVLNGAAGTLCLKLFFLDGRDDPMLVASGALGCCAAFLCVFNTALCVRNFIDTPALEAD